MLTKEEKEKLKTKVGSLKLQGKQFAINLINDTIDDVLEIIDGVPEEPITPANIDRELECPATTYSNTVDVKEIFNLDEISKDWKAAFTKMNGKWIV